jgi:hypothetical protein
MGVISTVIEIGSPWLQDSVVVESPLPGGPAAVVRFLFRLPQWFQIAGFVAGTVLAIIVAIALWRRRAGIAAWIGAQSRLVKIAMVGGAALVVLAAAATGGVSWEYMQHDNGFCTGCHVMEGAFTRFQASEHDSLSCHNCHQQSIFASMRQLYLWVAERPEKIGEHAPVGNSVCESCHVVGQPEVWQHIRSTAGHRAHLESDSSALANIMCVTCHGQEVHRFAPLDETCGQSGCHDQSDTQIKIGAMEGAETALHCVICHQFTAEVPALATRDSAAATLIPGIDRCGTCHEMQAVIDNFDPRADPHRGKCGSCHHPHEQQAAIDARTTCTSAGCHDNWRDEPFHVGRAHQQSGTRCYVCHEAHSARVDPSDCQGCHARVLKRTDIPETTRNRLQRATPFDTTAVLRRGRGALQFETNPQERSLTDLSPHGFWGVGALPQPPPGVTTDRKPTAVQDTFPHDRHNDLSCLTCHKTATGHGEDLTFKPPRGCQICHHRDPAESDCATCHPSTEINVPVAVSVTISVANNGARTRTVSLAHDWHATLQCVDCHTAPVTLAPAEGTRSCVDCHADHHTAGRLCSGCHESVHIKEAHAPPRDAHTGCDACHDTATVAGLTPDRSFCLTCHGSLPSDHYAASGRACTTCHFLMGPDEFRRQLLKSESGP